MSDKVLEDLPVEGDPVVGGEDPSLPVDEGMNVVPTNNPNTKYELTDTTRVVDGVTLYRIKALRDIPSKGVKSGELGGWVETENNLDTAADAWIYNDGVVMGSGFVTDSGEVLNTAIVRTGAAVTQYGSLYGQGSMGTSSLLSGRARCEGSISNGALVSDNAYILKGAVVDNLAFIKGDVRVLGHVSGNITVSGSLLLGANVNIAVPMGAKMVLSGDMQIDAAGALTLQVVV